SRSPLVRYKAPATPEPYTLSLHDALPISTASRRRATERRKNAIVNRKLATERRKRLSGCRNCTTTAARRWMRTAMTRRKQNSSRSEEHTSELQSPYDLVCRLLLEKKKKKT